MEESQLLSTNTGAQSQTSRPVSKRMMLAGVSAALCAMQTGLGQIKTAKVTGGEVEGVVRDGVTSFKGIPFAAPPVGDLRWRSPQPLRPWTGVRKAEAFAAAPMQDPRFIKTLGGSTNVSEDCLYLNVWTAAKDTTEKLPVMVWIYGGAFATGSTSIPAYDGTKLAQQGVVLVSIAYRLGPFGFLAHPGLSKEAGGASGCYGIQDQIAALRWIKQNIAQFGGDPSRVTIFGESAGGISVSILAVAPSAKGLFERAISESGGSMAPLKKGDEPGENIPSLRLAEKTGVEFLNRLGVKTIQAARGLSAERIQAAASGFGRFWPVADGQTLPGDAYRLYEAGKFNDTPVLIGSNSDEGAMFVHSALTPAAFEKHVRERYGPGAEAILKAYPHATDAQAFKSAKDLFRDSAFAWQAWTWARLQTRKGRNKAFLYYFDRRTRGSPDGATHAAEVVFVFRNLFGSSLLRPEDIALSDLVSSYWVNFAKSGDPNSPGLPAWPPFDDQNMNVMWFNKDPGVQRMPNLEKLEALDSYYAWRRQQAATRARP